MRWRLAPALILIVAAVTAIAPLAAALPGEGDLRVDGALRLPGAARLQPTDLALALVPETGGVVELAGSGATLRVDVVRYSEDSVDNPLGAPVRQRSGFTSERFTFADATLSVREAPAGSILALLADGLAASEVDLTDARVRGVAQGTIYPGLQTGGPSTAGTGGEAVEVAETVELAARSLAADLAGGFVLRADGPTLDVVSGGKTTTFTSGREETAASPASTTATNTLLVLTWSGRLALEAAGGELAAYSLSPVAASALEADAAHGVLTVDGDRHDLAGDALGLAGAITVRAVPTATAAAAPGDGGVAYSPGLRVAVAGDFTRVSVDSTTLREILVPAAGVLAALAGLVAIAWYWPLLKYGLTAAYTRLKEPELLDNEVRNGIYGIIKTNPGIAARSIHRESGQSWGTVVYHLRQLERHRLVKSSRVGRFRTYYESNGRYNGLEEGFAALQNEKTRGVARLIAESPGVTQEQLTRATALPQSTVSYYVRKLKQANLVEERRNGKYAAYFPGAQLANVLAAVDPRQPEGAAPTPAPSAG